MRAVAVALIDGEHYPPVVVDALAQLSDQFEFRAALFLGGSEKIRLDGANAGLNEVYGLPVVVGDGMIDGLKRVVTAYRPEVVVDLSDEPVLGYEQRFRLICHCLAEDVTFLGSDFQFNPVSSKRLCASPSLSIVGTGKRVGKTAISGFVARSLTAMVSSSGGKSELVVVAMGRGGPPEPEVVMGAQASIAADDLLRLSRRGAHAASDCYEDATLSRVTTIGCRRCGGGMAGQPFVSNVAEGVMAANALNPTFMILEGSGAAMPPVGTDARLVVVGAHQPIEYVSGYLGPYRLLTSDAMVITMAEEPLASSEKVRAIIERAKSINAELTIVPTVFRPEPVEPVRGRRVALFTTAAPAQAGMLSRHLEERYECRVEMVSTNLSDRPGLVADLSRDEMGGVDLVLTEIKAAAIDVVAETAHLRGLDVSFVDNIPFAVSPGSTDQLETMTERLHSLALKKFAESSGR